MAFTASRSRIDQTDVSCSGSPRTPIKNSVVFHVVEKNANPVRGCYELHQDLARLALKRGLDRILVFEDDVAPYELKAAPIRWINRFIRPHRFQALHLGYSMWGCCSPPRVHPLA